jgi:hypothetical protein
MGVVRLTRQLISFRSVDPGHGEDACQNLLHHFLVASGFYVERYMLDDGSCARAGSVSPFWVY